MDLYYEVLNNIKINIKYFTQLELINKIFIIFLIILFIIICSNKYKNYKNYENYENLNQENRNLLFKPNYYEIKNNTDIYDELYSIYYDTIHLDKTKNDYEINKIIKYIDDNNSFNIDIKILDVGCGTGYHVNKINNYSDKYNIIGIDKSKSMIKIAKEKYPKSVYKNMDILNNNLDIESFSHIICLNNTIYLLNNNEKKIFFENCNNLLQNYGYIILHVVDRNKFNPYNNKSEIKELHNPEKYGKKATSLIIKFSKNIEYFSNYEITEPDNYTGLFSKYKEKIQNFENNSIRKNEINMYICPNKELINIANSKGFKFKDKINLEPNYKNEYLFIFMKD